MQNLKALEHMTVFTMSCSHGPYNWEVKRSTKEFRKLHEDIHALALAKNIKVFTAVNLFVSDFYSSARCSMCWKHLHGLIPDGLPLD
jgi:hypothetical protein